MNVNHASYFRLHASYFVYLAQRAHGGRRGGYGWAPQRLRRYFGRSLPISDFMLPTSYFLMGLCYNTAETVTYSEE